MLQIKYLLMIYIFLNICILEIYIMYLCTTNLLKLLRYTRT